MDIQKPAADIQKQTHISRGVEASSSQLSLSTDAKLPITGIATTDHQLVHQEKANILALLERMDKLGLLSQPSERRDPLTGMLTKAAALSSSYLTELSKQVPGPRVLIFFDARDMGPAQKFGLDPKATDNLLASIDTSVTKAFANLPHQTFRLGGDEFAIIASVGDGAEQVKESLNSFIADMKTQRNKLFSALDPRVQKAQQYARTRTLTRELSAELEAKLADTFSEQEVVTYLKHHPTFGSHFSAQLADHPNSAIATRRAIVEFATNTFQKHAYPQSNITLVDFDAAIIHLGAQDLSPELMQIAIGKADELIHSSKAGANRELAEAAVLFPSDRPIRLEDRAAIAIVQSMEAAWETANAEFTRIAGASTSTISELQAAKTAILAAHGADPSCPGVYRKDLMGDFEVETLVSTDKKLYITEVDMPGFGATNNKLGYAKADQIFRELAETVKTGIPDAVMLRAGGALIALSSNPTELHELLTVRADFIDKYRAVTGSNQLGAKHAEFEHGTREALGERFSDNPLRPYLFPTFRTSTIEPRPGQTFNELFQELSWTRYPTSPIVPFLAARRFIANAIPEKALQG
jgi:GGDEF domain-containing protein